VSALCYPLGFSLFLLFAGIIVARARSTSRAGWLLVVVGSVWLLVMSLPITGYLLMRPLELSAGPYADPSELSRRGVRYIVVLGGSRVINDMTPADRWGPSLGRVIEGIRLWKNIPNSRLILSAGGAPAATSDAHAMAALPIQLGVPREALVLETRAWDTADEADLLHTTLGREPFVLVTSAGHIPRAMRQFRRLGLEPIPAPCDFRTKRLPIWYRWFLPEVTGLEVSTSAIHEYIGGIWLLVKETFSGEPHRSSNR
jgi:uncharacterized SAM-binding protein YcdF (DUF218 family)